MKTIANVLKWNPFVFPVGLPCVTQTWRKPWKKLSPYWLNEWCNWQPKKNDDVICLRLWRGTYTQQCWIPMWILLWYSDSCFCDCLCVKSECPRGCQKRTFGMPRTNALINRNTASGCAGLVNYMVWALLTVNSELLSISVCARCVNPSVRVVSIKLQYMLFCSNKLSLIGWVLLVKFHHDLFIIFVFIVFMC